MRPVNLIPPDERGSDRGTMRTGAFSYVLIGALALALLGVIALAFTSKQVSDRKSEVAKLTTQEQQAEAKAQSLQAFANFRAVQQQRSTTITSLAQSRFDWQRVIDELARVIPSNVWLVQLAGTVNPQVSLTDAPEIQIRDDVAGPALELVGCATTQDAVAGFVSALEEIDGVTRVGLQQSDKVDDNGSIGGAVTSGSGEDTNTECRTNTKIPKFEIVVAFDSVPTPSGAVTDPSVPSSLATTAATQATSQPASTPSTGG
jgi:Tfp pilus assembly protein PilN